MCGVVDEEGGASEGLPATAVAPVAAAKRRAYWCDRRHERAAREPRHRPPRWRCSSYGDGWARERASRGRPHLRDSELQQLPNSERLA
eukprot:39342-Chlamydomonas_euryale.AAC.5